MAITVFENSVMENTITDIVNSKLDAANLMTMDYSLSTAAGMKKTIHKYTYTGAVEQLAKGAANTTYGGVAYTTKDYDVLRYQQAFKYNDVDVMTDPEVLDVATMGAATLMANDIKSKYFDELAKISNAASYVKGGKPSYSTFVDALAQLNQEVEDGMFIVMGNDLKAAIRKDADFIASKQGEILYSGQFGSIAGVPVLFSKLVPAKVAYITRKDAVKFFVKKDGQVETTKNIETKDNTVVYTRYGLIALVDDTKSIKVSEATA